MCDISLGEKLVHCSNRDRTPFNTHFFIQIIIIIIMITMKIEAILEKLGRGVEQRRKRIIEIPRQEEGRGRIKISWDFYASILLGWQRGKGETFRARPWVSRVESNKFSHIPGETRLSPSPFLPSVSLTKKSSTFGLRGFVQATQGTRGIKFVLE